MSKAFFAAFLLLLASAVLGTTAFREPLAQAARAAQGVMITNTADQAVPVREQGKLATHPVVPARPWHRVRSVNVGSSPFLTEPVDSINITSLTVADEGLTGASAVLDAVTVPDTALECSGETGDILWFTTALARPLAVTFPTPLVASAPAGSKVCLRAAASGESGDHVLFSLSGFMGDD